MLTLTLLGPFQGHVDGRAEPLRLPTQKSVALLAYLALNHEGPVSRDVLARLFGLLLLYSAYRMWPRRLKADDAPKPA